MRSTEAALLSRLDALIVKGDAVALTAVLVKYLSPQRYSVDNGLYANWWSQSVQALTSLLGETSNYTQAFVKQVSEHAWLVELETGMGILKAVREDAVNGHLFATTAGLISGEIFSDFLEMAEHLLDNGYWQPAASLIGAVLEDSMRRIAPGKQVAIKSGDDISTLNQKLAQAGVYTQIVRKQIQVWNDVRNSADHAKWDEFTEEEVQNMRRGVSGFLAEYL